MLIEASAGQAHAIRCAMHAVATTNGRELASDADRAALAAALLERPTA